MPWHGWTPYHDRITRADVLRHAIRRYHAGDITLAELVRALTQWRH